MKKDFKEKKMDVYNVVIAKDAHLLNTVPNNLKNHAFQQNYMIARRSQVRRQMIAHCHN